MFTDMRRTWPWRLIDQSLKVYDVVVIMRPGKGQFAFAIAISSAIAWTLCAALRAAEPAASADTATATLVVESAELAGMRSIPIINSRKITFTVSSFAGCPADAKQAPVLKQLASGSLAPKRNSQSDSVPGDTDLAVFAEFTNASGGNSVSCERALRFHSEAGRTYHVRYTPPKQQMFHAVACDMTIVEIRDGAELPVPSAHDALLENKGFWKGSDLNICASASPETNPLAN